MATTNAGFEAERDPIEVMAESFLERFRRGERPSVDEYAAKYPELADEIRELLPALVQLERDLSITGEVTGAPQPGPRAASLPGAPRQLGDYTILREIGRGGMGVVYEAVQRSLGRHVALKVLPWSAMGASSQLERFQFEARSAAKLHHTNIVPVFGVGEAEGMHYYAMQFIHGPGLDTIIDELRRVRDGKPAPGGEATVAPTIAATVARELLGDPVAATEDETVCAGESEGTSAGSAARSGSGSADGRSALTSHSELAGTHNRRYYRQAARLALQVAEGLVYAHGQGVLHRDIKPANLLVDTQGTVWITDFGLAKADGSDGPTRTGDVLGTLRYMAPERFEGGSDRRSDVYALGATLYELLTLQPIFGDINRAKLLDRIQHEPPAPPRRLDRRIPRDLETIVLKALAKEPAQRYRDAEAMAADLRRFIDDRPILTRRVSTTEQVWRWCRRNPMVAGLLALVLALLVGGTVAGGLAAHHFRALAQSESLARGRADSLVETERQANELATRRAAEAQAARAQADAKAREAQAVADFLVMDLIGAAATGKGRGTQMTVGEALARADAAIDTRFADQPVLAATIHLQMGHTYIALTDAAKSLVHFRAASELRARHLGPDARETLAARQMAALALRETGNREEARTILEDVLERQRRALGPEDLDTLETMAQIGGYLFPNNNDRAPQYYRELHEILSRVVGPEDVHTINALHMYALTMMHQGNHAGAEATIRQALALRLRTRGEVDAATFWTMADLVTMLIKARRCDAAWLDVDRFWTVMARHVNPDHVKLKQTTESLLTIAAVTSNWARAEAFFDRQARALAADLGPGNIRTLHAQALLARTLAEQGHSDEARAMAGEVPDAALECEAEAGVEVVFERAIATINRAGGAGSGAGEITRKLRARAQQRVVSGNPKHAVSPLLLAIRLGADDAQTWDSLRRIAAGVQADDRLSKAMLDHGQALERRGDLDGTLAAYREATRLAPKDALAHFAVGRILHRRGDKTGALDEYREALRLKADLWDVYVFLAQLDPQSVEGLDRKEGVSPEVQNNVAWGLVKATDAPSDPRSIALGVRLAQAAVKAEPQNGGFRNTLGVALYRTGDWTRAIAELDESVRIRSGDQGYSYDGFFLAMAHWRLGDELKALAYCDRSVHLMELQAPSDRELVQFRAEAEALLDVSRPRPDFRKVVGDFSAVTYFQTGMASGNRGDWAAALADLRRVFELGGGGRGETSDPISDPSQAWLYRAALEVEFGDRDAYREHCRRMVERFEGSTNAGELERTAKAGLFDPPPSWEEAARLRSPVPPSSTPARTIRTSPGTFSPSAWPSIAPATSTRP